MIMETIIKGQQFTNTNCLLFVSFFDGQGNKITKY